MIAARVGYYIPLIERSILMQKQPWSIGISLLLAFALSSLSAAFPVTVVDDRGHSIAIGAIPERIVAVGALYAEIALDLGAGDRLVAVAESPDNPTGTVHLPSVGPTYAPSVELIVAFEPDLVLGATDWGGERPALEAAGIVVLTTPLLTSVASIFDAIETIGHALGAADQSTRLIGRIATEIVEEETAILGRAAVRAAFLYASSTDDPPYTAGAGAIEHELIFRAGGTNVFADVQGFPQVSFEEVIARNPDVIFTAPTQIENILANPLLQTVSAVVEGQVFGVRASVVASTRVAEALRAMIEALHGTGP